jgi:hypothetical protein
MPPNMAWAEGKERREGKILLFLKKKKQKDFYQFAYVAQSRRFELGHLHKLIKVFLLLFCKKEESFY